MFISTTPKPVEEQHHTKISKDYLARPPPQAGLRQKGVSHPFARPGPQKKTLRFYFYATTS